MIRPFLKTIALGFVVQSALHLVCFAEPSSAELSGPLAAVTVDPNLPHYAARTPVSGVFKVHGSDTMSLLLARLSMEFQRLQPKTAIEVRGGGSVKAIAELLQPPLSKTSKVMLFEERAAHVQLIATSRELRDAEVKAFVAQHGYEPTAIPVAVDAVALYVHKDNPLPGLTLDQADAIFSTTRKRGGKIEIAQWGHLGLGDGWGQAPIRLYGRDRRSGTKEFFQEHCLEGGDFKPGIHEAPGAASVVLDLSRDPLGIGYSGLALQSSAVRVVPIADAPGRPLVTPSLETVADHTYPLRRVLYLYLDQPPKTPVPAAVQEFLTFILSQEGQQAVTKAGFFPLPSTRVTRGAIALGFSTNSTQIQQ